jgi:hypothetical protein
MVASGKDHCAWIGDDVQKGQLHAWVRKELLKMMPLICTKCGSTKHIETANLKHHVYTRNPSDYTFLCKRCHNEMDGIFGNLKQGVDAIYNSPRYNPDMTEKRCPVCGIIKALSDFYTDGDGLRTECKLCTQDIHKQQYKETHKETPLLTLWENVANGVRVCTKCGVSKPLSEFHSQPGRFTGTRSWCKDCIHACANARHVRKTTETSRVMKQREDMKNGFRTCKTCGYEKPLDDFPKNDNGTRASCKTCYNAHQANKRLNRKCY